MAGCNQISKKKIFFQKKKKKIEKIEKNSSKASCWVPLTWLEHAQDIPRTCPGHAQDMAGHAQDTAGHMRTHMGF